MKHSFRFRGGIHNPNPRYKEQFFCFIVAGGDEVPLAIAQSTGIAFKGEEENTYHTSFPIIKIFTQRMKYGESRLYQHFYFKLDPGERIIRAKPFNAELPFYLECVGKLLKKKEALKYVKEKKHHFIKKMPLLPKVVRDRMIEISEPTVDKVRFIRL